MAILMMFACLGLSFDLVGGCDERIGQVAAFPCQCQDCDCRASAMKIPASPANEPDRTKIAESSTPVPLRASENCQLGVTTCSPGQPCFPAEKEPVVESASYSAAVPAREFVSPTTYRRGIFGRRCRSGSCR
jgi:hypothetical protein